MHQRRETRKDTQHDIRVSSTVCFLRYDGLDVTVIESLVVFGKNIRIDVEKMILSQPEGVAAKEPPLSPG
jgi:hypothetical protein